ncbi:MAG: TSUP family transporter, partial [Crocinitomicaceae bacterium]|nr:TSUP family transporter [Crocinitomicaceae bacterium]
FVVKSKKCSFDTNRLWLGGIITGFFGGLSGHQGAFRSAFLAQTDLDKASFIATSNVLSLGIDISRLLVYSSIFSFQLIVENQNILYVGILFAFVGTYFGSKLLHKTTMDGVQKTVGIALILMGAGLISGLL